MAAPILDAHGSVIGVEALHLPVGWLDSQRSEVLAFDVTPDTDLVVLDHDGDVVPGFRPRSAVTACFARAARHPGASERFRGDGLA